MNRYNFEYREVVPKVGIVKRMLIVFLMWQCYLFAALGWLCGTPFCIAALLPAKPRTLIWVWADKAFFGSTKFWTDTAKRINREM